MEKKMEKDQERVWTLSEAVENLPKCQNLEDLCRTKAYEYKRGQQTVRLAASNVAKVAGLHDYARIAEDFMDLLYQDLYEMLQHDAKLLSLEIVSKRAELEYLIEKSGKDIAPELKSTLSWTSQKSSTSNTVTTALREKVLQLVTAAESQKNLTSLEAEEVRRSLIGRISKGLGIRNESIAIQFYEKLTGYKVEANNDRLYVLEFPKASDLSNVDALDKNCRRHSFSIHPSHRKREREEITPMEQLHFSIAGKIDGLVQDRTILVEVKNRTRSFRIPPPLYDQIQSAVYMKMVGLEHGDLVQYMHHDQGSIHVTRIGLAEPPLRTGDAWRTIVLPRLYQYVDAVYKVREDAMLRLSFLNGTPEEQETMVKGFLPFLDLDL